ncbi:hypothetical protein ABIB49_003843, partial [Arthrobacter sp. UYCu512]|uniref:hypothetical protein n=1 Tax=Arthrobacter sp. UYCu512 TaxID=3156338 RepID=UPI0033958FAC
LLQPKPNPQPAQLRDHLRSLQLRNHKPLQLRNRTNSALNDKSEDQAAACHGGLELNELELEK